MKRRRIRVLVRQENVDNRKESVAMELRHSVAVHFDFCPGLVITYQVKRMNTF